MLEDISNRLIEIQEKRQLKARLERNIQQLRAELRKNQSAYKYWRPSYLKKKQM